jgi:hypothetical protein
LIARVPDPHRLLPIAAFFLAKQKICVSAAYAKRCACDRKLIIHTVLALIRA